MARVRMEIWDRDGGVCRRCNQPIDIDASPMSPDGLTIGHVLPASKGGTDARHNLAPEHRRCNLAAGATGDPLAALAQPPGF